MIKGPEEYFNVRGRTQVTEDQENEYFDYLMDSINEINPFELSNEINLGYSLIKARIGDIVFNFLFYHHQEDMIPWSKCRRMFQYSYKHMRELGLVG